MLDNYTKCEEAYRSDPMFHQLVKNLENLIHMLKLSPAEVRAAAMFAVYLHELHNPEPVMVGLGEVKYE